MEICFVIILMFIAWFYYMLSFKEEAIQENFRTKAFQTSRKFEN